MVVVKANKMWKADVSSIQKLQVITTKKKDSANLLPPYQQFLVDLGCHLAYSDSPMPKANVGPVNKFFFCCSTKTYSRASKTHVLPTVCSYKQQSSRAGLYLV